MVEQKIKPQVESPLFLTEKNQTEQFGFGQAQSFSQGLATSGVLKNEKEQKSVVFKDVARAPSHKSGWVLGIFLILLLSALGGAYYYFYVYSTKLGGPSDHAVPQPMQPVSVIPNDEKPAFEFSLVSPNYLSVNVETVSAAGLRAQLGGIGAELKLLIIPRSGEVVVDD